MLGIVRTGPASSANLAADTVTHLENPVTGDRNAPGFVETATNPLPIINGIDPQLAEVIKQIAPEEVP